MINSLSEDNLQFTLVQTYQKAICKRKWSITKDRSDKEYDRREEKTSRETSRELKSSVRVSEDNDVQLKQLLQMSDSSFVKKYLNLEKHFDSSITDQQKHLTNHVYLKWTLDMETMLKEVTEKVLGCLRIPIIESIQIEAYHLVPKKLQTTEISVSCQRMEVTGKAKVSIFSWSNTDEILETKRIGNKLQCLILEKSLSLGPKTEFSGTKTVFFNDCVAEKVLFRLGYFAICCKNGLVFVFSLKQDQFVYHLNLEPNCVPLAFALWDDSTFSCLVWDTDASRLEFSRKSDGLGVLQLAEKPTSVKQCENVYAFVQPEQTIVIWHSKINVDLKISRLQHGLSSIDNMVLEDEQILFLLDYKLHLIVKFHVASTFSRECSIQKVMKIDDFSKSPTKFMTVARNTILARCESGETYSVEITDVQPIPGIQS